jgi:hypothetical protein
MSEGYRGVLATIGITLLVTVALAAITWPSPPVLRTYNYEHPRAGGYAAGGHECDPFGLPFIPHDGEALRKRDDCAKEAEEQRINTNDLIQQTRAADAAVAQADLAAQAIWLTFFQTLGGFLTLVAAGVAAYFAREAAEHTKRGADEAKTANDIVTRPVVYFSGGEGRIKFDGREISITSEIRIENGGNYPVQLTGYYFMSYLEIDGKEGGAGGNSNSNDIQTIGPGRNLRISNTIGHTRTKGFDSRPKIRVLCGVRIRYRPLGGQNVIDRVWASFRADVEDGRTIPITQQEHPRDSKGNPYPVVPEETEELP